MEKKELNLMIQGLHTKQMLNDLALFFKVFGDETRLRMIDVLAHQPMCVGDIATILEMTPSSISHQLSMLRAMNLVQATKEGKTVFYQLSDAHIVDIFEKGLEHISEKVTDETI
ncbi:MAG: winged helix-turn-helix transcriptional regulator [Bacilli bacterium]|jgi:DNA-binding transcriptional ArsR family regulator|nr:winged helix-turn-helix transcriptional regulator [Bacilli bacterium]